MLANTCSSLYVYGIRTWQSHESITPSLSTPTHPIKMNSHFNLLSPSKHTHGGWITMRGWPKMFTLSQLWSNTSSQTTDYWTHCTSTYRYSHYLNLKPITLFRLILTHPVKVNSYFIPLSSEPTSGGWTTVHGWQVFTPSEPRANVSSQTTYGYYRPQRTYSLLFNAICESRANHTDTHSVKVKSHFNPLSSIQLSSSGWIRVRGWYVFCSRHLSLEPTHPVKLPMDITDPTATIPARVHVFALAEPRANTVSVDRNTSGKSKFAFKSSMDGGWIIPITRVWKCSYLKIFELKRGQFYVKRICYIIRRRAENAAMLGSTFCFYSACFLYISTESFNFWLVSCV